jgi:hypothetical protein
MSGCESCLPLDFARDANAPLPRERSGELPFPWHP